MVWKFIAFVRNSEYPSDCFKFVCSLSNFEQARSFFLLSHLFITPDDLRPFLSPRQFSRLKTFYNKPRHYDLFILDVASYRVTD